MVIWKPHDSIRTKAVTDKNGESDLGHVTPLLDGTKAKEREEESKLKFRKPVRDENA